MDEDKFVSWRCSSISAIREGKDMPRSAAMASSAVQNWGSSAIEVRWPAMVSERLRTENALISFGRNRG
jgi:hypothetical protein